MQKFAFALGLTMVAAAPWPFSMWRSSPAAFSEKVGQLPSFYHTSEQMEHAAQSLAEQCHGLTVETLSDGARQIQVAKYKAPGSSPQFKTMIVAGEHARELIGSEIALNFIKALCSKDAAADIEAAKVNTEFLVVMNANPGSRKSVENGDTCKRVDPAGVDINRNFETADWANQGQSSQGDTNPGTHAFSEPESRILKNLMLDFKPHAYLDVHSGFKGMFFPNAVANDLELSTKLQRLVAPVDEAACNCPLGTANKEVGYYTAGSALDYTFSVLKVPFSMAMEVYLDPHETSEIAKLEARWNTQKSELLKPIATGGSFLEDGVSADKVFPMNLINSGDNMIQSQHGQINCLTYFNPVESDTFDKVVSTWTNALAQLSIKSKAIPVNAAIEALKKPAQDLKFREYVQEMPEESSPVWFALKCLGLLLVIYVGFKYYKVKQGKSAEEAPLHAQMAPVQVSD